MRHGLRVCTGVHACVRVSIVGAPHAPRVIAGAEAVNTHRSEFLTWELVR